MNKNEKILASRLLSVIVPVYNTERFLTLCLDSLLNQDLPPEVFEIICVDDGSTDGSAKILADYAKKFSNIHVITQKNAGHASARNTGLSAAHGQYVWFVDSDDYVDVNCFSFVTKIMKENGIDLLSINYCPFYDDSELPTVAKNYVYPTKKKKNPIACSGIRIFSRALLENNNIVWNEKLSPCDDIEFIFFAQLNAQNIVFNDSVSYYHRRWAGSVTSNKSEESRRKYVESFYLLAEVYDRELKNPKYNKKKLREIEMRRNLSVQAILMNEAMRGNNVDEILERLKKGGLYPYKPIMYNLYPKLSVRRTLMDWAQFLFPYESYFRLMCRILKKVIK